jgi:hypothetical protein
VKEFRRITQLESWRQAAQPGLIERLESLLSRAKAGELQSIAYACHDVGGATTYGYTELLDTGRTLAALARLQHQILQNEREAP